MEFDPKKFQDFIVVKFAEWRGTRRISLADYATHVGVSSQVMSNWYNGKLKERPSPENYQKLIKSYGLIVYDVLNLPRPVVVSAPEWLSMLPKNLRHSFEVAAMEIKSKISEADVSIDSPEGVEIAKNVLLKRELLTEKAQADIDAERKRDWEEKFVPDEDIFRDR